MLNLDEIKARAEKATPNTKRIKGVGGSYCIGSDDGRMMRDIICLFWGRDEQDLPNAAANSDLFAHARKDVLDLVAEVERLRAEVQRLKDECDQKEAERLDACNLRNLAYMERDAQLARLRPYADPRLFAAASDVLEVCDIAESIDDLVGVIERLTEAVAWWDALPAVEGVELEQVEVSDAKDN